MRRILVFAAFLLLAGASGCENPVKFEDYVWRFVDLEEAAQVSAHLKSRVFWQRDGPGDARSLKRIVIDFRDGLSVEARHSVGGEVVDEWKVFQNDYYWIERAHGHPIYRFDFTRPTVERLVPEDGGDPVDPEGLMILVRDYGRNEEIRFALQDSAGALPSPFPVFERWTRFVEDDVVPSPPGSAGGPDAGSAGIFGVSPPPRPPRPGARD